MKKLSMIFAVICIAISPIIHLQAQVVNEGDIVDSWINEKGDEFKITVIKDKFFGEVVKLKVPNYPDGKPKLDTINPNPALDSIPIKGKVFLKWCKFDTRDFTWKGGIIYDYNDGKYSDVVMEFRDAEQDTLDIKVYNVGADKTTYWTKKE